MFDCSINRFFVKGQESIYYTYNNGKLASDPKLACQNFINALERIPKVIESHEKEMAKVVANKDVYINIANSSWKKEDELRALKGEAAELDRKIALTLAPPEEQEEEEKENEQSGLSQEIKQKSIEESPTQKVKTQSPTHAPKERIESHDDVMSRMIISKPKWR